MSAHNPSPPSLFLLFNHALTPEQHADARASLGVGEVVEPPEDVRELWSNLNPELDGLFEVLAPVRQWLAGNARPGDFVLIQGDFGASWLMVRHAREPGVIVKMIWEKDRFRVMTAFSPVGGQVSFQEVREQALRKIQMEKIGHVQWCTEETWRLSASGHRRSSGKGAKDVSDERRKGREKRQEPRKRHVRGKNWRSVLADQDE